MIIAPRKTPTALPWAPKRLAPPKAAKAAAAINTKFKIYIRVLLTPLPNPCYLP